MKGCQMQIELNYVRFCSWIGMLFPGGRCGEINALKEDLRCAGRTREESC